MSRPIVRLYVVFALLFGVLAGFTSYWSVWDAEDLNDNPRNARSIIAEARIKRGTIRAADGTVLARSVRARGGTYRRSYPRPDLFPHEVGYSFLTRGRAGLEQFYNDDLAGRKGEFTSLVEQLEGRRREGEDLRTTLDARAQQVALEALGGRNGSVVAMEPSTGEVKVMASVPGYDPNDIDQQTTFQRLLGASDDPLVNRATASSYPPGSTFKVVTAAAALDSGKFTPDSVVDGSNGKDFGGVPLNNFGGQDYGPVDLTTALTNSINTVWAQVGTSLGKDTMGEYMRRFGFYKDPALDLPRNERRASGEYFEGKLLKPDSDRIDVARMAIGQDKLAVTPLQMAIVAATVANGGVLVRPHIGDRFIDADGRTTKKIAGRSGGRVMSKEAAGQLGQMMANVVREGSGTAAALEGVEVAGKTGTAEIDPAADINQPWFIGFAPLDNPRIAIAVTIERSDGTGGEVAAPVAKKVLEALT
ncbi:MAG: peptidoglycan D,D-transpeptidase FtsI family protein [Solirubrobacteraceae bacterium]